MILRFAPASSSVGWGGATATGATARGLGGGSPVPDHRRNRHPGHRREPRRCGESTRIAGFARAGLTEASRWNMLSRVLRTCVLALGASIIALFYLLAGPWTRAGTSGASISKIVCQHRVSSTLLLHDPLESIPSVFQGPTGTLGPIEGNDPC